MPSYISVCSLFVTDDEQEECREQLCNCGALPALIQLASMDDEATKLRCVVAFANLSCEYTIRGQMVRGRQTVRGKVLPAAHGFLATRMNAALHPHGTGVVLF